MNASGIKHWRHVNPSVSNTENMTSESSVPADYEKPTATVGRRRRRRRTSVPGVKGKHSNCPQTSRCSERTVISCMTTGPFACQYNKNVGHVRNRWGLLYLRWKDPTDPTYERDSEQKTNILIEIHWNHVQFIQEAQQKHSNVSESEEGSRSESRQIDFHLLWWWGAL